MNAQVVTLMQYLGLPEQRAEAIAHAIQSIADSTAGHRVTVRDVVDQTDEEPDIIKEALSALSHPLI